MNRKCCLLVFLAFCAAPALATPENWEVFRKHYTIADTSRIGKAKCLTCHTTVPARNGYGNDLAKAGPPRQTITDATLIKVESLDSDGDGISNGEEIKADFLPGDPKSKPAQSAATPAAPTPPPAESPLIPTHTFHPVIVHFPIALFIIGGFWDLLGHRKAKSGLRDAGKWAMQLGAFAAWGAVATGLVAFLRLGYEWTGTPLIHFLLASSSTLLMTGVALWRNKHEPTTATYFATVLLSMILVGVAGHFGGLLVYG